MNGNLTTENIKNEALAGVKTSTEQVIKKRKLFDNDLLTSLEEAAELFKDLVSLLENASSIVENDAKLMESSYDHKWLSEIKRIVEENKGNTEYLINVLSRHLRYIERRDTILAQFIARYRPTRTEQMKLLTSISAMIEDPSKLSANVDILLETVEKLEDKLLKAKLRNTLLSIKKFLGEIRALNYYLYDVNGWNLHVHNDIHFFTGRIKGYFKGGIIKDREGKDVEGIDFFEDAALRKTVFGSIEVKRVYYLASFTHKVEEQIAFISGLIASLQKDIENEVWVQDVATKEFLSKIDEHANTFLTKFANEPFAKTLLNNKGNIGEQPFRWIDLLNRMKASLENLMTRKNAVIEGAMKYLNGAFGNRLEQLKALIATISSRITRILKETTGDIDVIRQIQEGLKRIERVVQRLWVERKKKFKNVKGMIDSKSADVIPNLVRAIELTNLDLEARKLAQYAQTAVNFGEHTDMLLDMINPLDSRHSSHALMLGFDFKTLGETAEGINEIGKEVKGKAKTFQNIEFAPLIKSVRELIAIYNEFINLVKLMMIGIETDAIAERMKKLRLIQVRGE